MYGIGLPTSKKILADAGVSEDIRVRDLTPDQEDAIRREVDAIKVEGDLRREVNLNIKRLMEIGSYRGIRHRRGLPVRGQTRHNLCFHQFLLYLVFQTQSFAILPLKRKAV